MIAGFVLAGALAVAGPPTRPPLRVRQPGAFRGAPLPEASGAAMSRRYPGRFWTINDSGNEPTLFLVDTTARVGGSVALPVRNRDWESVSLGPCGSGAAPAAPRCVYIADIGDNRAVRPSVVLYRLPEPDERTLAAGRTGAFDSLSIRYADGPRDAEALVVLASGDAAIITKGREGDVLAYWIPAAAWAGRRTVVRSMWRLPISPSLFFRTVVTDAALSPDEQWLAVRSYREVHLFRRNKPSGLPDQPVAVCPVDGLEPVGEGITWFDVRTLLLTSEATRNRPGPVTLLECPAA